PSVDRVPDLDGVLSAIRAGRGDAPAVGRLPGHGPNQTLYDREIGAPLPGRRVPDIQAAVAGRSNLLAVGAERHAPDFIVVLERQAFLAIALPDRSRVPDAYGPVAAGRRKAPAVGIGAEGQACAYGGMPPQAEHFPAGRRVPNTHRLVFAGGSNEPAVPTEGDAQDVPGMDELADRVTRP